MSFGVVRNKSLWKEDIKPIALEKAERKQARLDKDEEGTKEVHERSKGICEIKWFGKKARKPTKCTRPRMIGVHHMIYGHGKRGRGISALAMHKQDVCEDCHRLITQHILKRVGGDVPLWTDEYERVDR